MNRIIFFLGVLSFSSFLFAHDGDIHKDSSSTTVRTITNVAPNIYMIRHPDAPDGFPQGNTTVIIGDREVLVVDACYLPSSAKQDIEQIQKWTSKPVRYLVNTHWHYDHTMGNGTYAEAFPGISIIAHHETKRIIQGYNPGWFARFPNRSAIFKSAIESGKDANGNKLSESDIRDYKKYLDGLTPVQEEFSKIKDRAPNLSFDHELTIDLGNREVQIKHLGRGNSAGDIILYLPKEKIIVIGDLMDHPVPYLGSGFPGEQVETLNKIAQLDADTFIPGHGNVLTGKSYLFLLRDFLAEVVAAVRSEIEKVGNNPRLIDQVRESVHKRVDFTAWKKRFVGDNKEDGDFFDSFSVQGVFNCAFNELVRK